MDFPCVFLIFGGKQGDPPKKIGQELSKCQKRYEIRTSLRWFYWWFQKKQKRCAKTRGWKQDNGKESFKPCLRWGRWRWMERWSKFPSLVRLYKPTCLHWIGNGAFQGFRSRYHPKWRSIFRCGFFRISECISFNKSWLYPFNIYFNCT